MFLISLDKTLKLVSVRHLNIKVISNVLNPLVHLKHQIHHRIFHNLKVRPLHVIVDEPDEAIEQNSIMKKTNILKPIIKCKNPLLCQSPASTPLLDLLRVRKPLPRILANHKRLVLVVHRKLQVLHVIVHFLRITVRIKPNFN